MILSVATGILLLEQRVVLQSKHLWGFPDVGRVEKWVLSLNGKRGMWLTAILGYNKACAVHCTPLEQNRKEEANVKNTKHWVFISVKDSRI